MTDAGIVIIGAGQGGYQLACSLREAEFNGQIHLVGDEPHLPYQRPPLSKAYLSGEATADQIQLRRRHFYDTRLINLHVGDRAVAVDRIGRSVCLASGVTVPYQHLVFATGSRPRALLVPGAELEGVRSLHRREDADMLKKSLSVPSDVVVIGGGFIGLETAAIASASGHRVTVVESLDRTMSRAVSPELSEYVTCVHRQLGTDVLLGRTVVSLHGKGGLVREVELDGGKRIPANLVIVGIGVEANSALASTADLTVSDGVVVDERLLTSDSNISALGDCARFPSVHSVGQIRLESVQNAVDQARFIATRLVRGNPGRYDSVPWFWTHQAGLKVQMVGVGTADDTRIVVGEPRSGAFSVFRFQGERLLCVESVNRMSDHISARRILGQDIRPTPSQVAAPGFDLKTFAKSVLRELPPTLYPTSVG